MSIHPTADVSSECQIGPGTLIWHYAQVREGAVIGATCILGKGVYVDVGVTVGKNCKLQNGVSVFRSAVLEDGVFLGPGVIITNDLRPRAINVDGTLKRADDWAAARVLLRVGAAIGAGSVVLAGVTVGRWAMIGAGSTVTRDVPDHALAVGSPARVIGYVCACGNRLADASDRVCGTCPAPFTGQL